MTRPSATGRSKAHRRRAPGAPYATTLVALELLPGTVSYCDDSGDGLPFLVVDLGYTELHISIPAAVATLDDLAMLDRIGEAVFKLRRQLVMYLG